MYSVKIIQDSVNPAGVRLTTFELTYPRYIHAQLMTHRQFSRNAASSRAMPVKKMIERVKNRPVEPLHWGRNQKGMQAYQELKGWRLWMAKRNWKKARKAAIKYARRFEKLGCHKQYANRVLEPFMYITTIVTATEYDNFFHLRCGDAQPEIAYVARLMYENYRSHKPTELKEGEWHTPYVVMDHKDDPLYVAEEFISDFKKISAARCARVSYLTHDGERDFKKDIELHDRLVGSGHWSPLEHVAQAMDSSDPCGNIRGFKQYRKFFSNECVARYREPVRLPRE